MKEMVHPFEAVEIIEIPPTDAHPQLGRQSTVSLCKAFKVKDQKQVEKIDEIKDIVVYKQGFANGMIFFFLLLGLATSRIGIKFSRF